MADEETFDYEVPVVTWDEVTKRVERENDEGQIVVENDVTGHRVNPPYDESWDEITKLRWFAALIGHRTGVQVRVAQRTKVKEVDSNTGPGTDRFFTFTYQISTQRMEYTDTPAPYDVTWAWLSGLEAGIYEGRISS
jgi:hypothetical protein